MNNGSKFGSESILKIRTYDILIVCKISAYVETMRREISHTSHILIRITALDDVLKKVLSKKE